MISDEEKEYQNRAFQNVQRILSDHYSGSFALMGLLLASNTAGFTGLYTIWSDINWCEQKPIFNWLTALCIPMFLSNVALYLVWKREHSLKTQAIKTLNKIPNMWRQASQLSNKCWKGVTGTVWEIIFVSAIGVWFIQSIHACLLVQAWCVGEAVLIVLPAIFVFYSKYKQVE